MGDDCSGILGDLEKRTCANPNVLLDEIAFKRVRERENL